MQRLSSTQAIAISPRADRRRTLRAAVAMLVPVLCVLLLLHPATAQQENVTVLRGSGPNHSSSLVLRMLNTVKTRAGKPVALIYRALPAATSSTASSGSSVAQADFIENPTKVDFAVGSQSLSGTQWSGMGPGDVLQVPFAMLTVSVFYNIPGTNTAPLNLTACMIQKLLTGAITTWTPSISQNNPTLGINDQTIKVNMFMDAVNAQATQILLAYLEASGCPVTSTSSLTAVPSTDVSQSVMRTSYSVGYALTYRGKALNLREAAIQNANQQYVLSTTLNLTSTQAAVAAVLPTSYIADFSTVGFANLPGSMVYPALTLAYLYLRTNQTTTGDKGALLQGMAKYMLSSEAQGYCAAAGMLSIGNTTNALTALATGIKLQPGVVPYTLEPLGVVAPNGMEAQTISATRSSYERVMLDELQTQVTFLRSIVAQSIPKLLRGSGSSAVAMAVWRAMDVLTAQATTPVWTSYRAISSGAGEAELAGSPVGSAAAVDFACSDNPMTKTTHTALANTGIKIIQLPLYLAPVSLFVNIPVSALPRQRLRLSACTVAGILQGTIRSWDDPAIALDNPAVTLPAQPITPIYRTGASGTNGVFSQYFASACPQWTLGSGRTLPAAGATGAFSTAAVGVGSGTDMVDRLKNITWSIGYVDTGAGVLAGLMEVSLKNRAGNWLRAQNADLPSVAARVFQSGGWPADPTADFSGVSLLDQPGEMAWPITSVPFLMVRDDLTPRGPSGTLMVAFLSYFLSSAFQQQLPLMGFGPLPADLLAFSVQKALPLLSVDTRASPWLFEPSSGARFLGAGDSVFSTAKDTYSSFATSRYMTEYFTAAAAEASIDTAVNTTGNNTGLNSTHLSMLAELARRLDNTEKQLVVMQSIAIASLVFAMAAMALAIFAGFKLFIVGVLSQRNQVNISSTRSPLVSGAGSRSSCNKEDASTTITKDAV